MSQDSERADQVAHRFFLKLAQLVHHARAAAPASTAPPSSKPDIWFNLEIPSPSAKLFKEPTRPYSSLSSLSKPPLPFTIQVLLVVPKLASNQVLVHCPPGGSRTRLQLHPVPTHILIEEWTLSGTSTHPILSADEDDDSRPSKLYKNGVQLFRWVYTLLYLLPAWRVARARRQRFPLQLRVMGDPPLESTFLGFHVFPFLSTTEYNFSPIGHPLARLDLCLSVRALCEPAFSIEEMDRWASVLVADTGPHPLLLPPGVIKESRYDREIPEQSPREWLETGFVVVSPMHAPTIPPDSPSSLHEDSFSDSQMPAPLPSHLLRSSQIFRSPPSPPDSFRLSTVSVVASSIPVHSELPPLGNLPLHQLEASDVSGDVSRENRRMSQDLGRGAHSTYDSEITVISDFATEAAWDKLFQRNRTVLEQLHQLWDAPDTRPQDGQTSRAFLESIVQRQEGVSVLVDATGVEVLPRIELLDEIAVLADSWELRARCLDILRRMCGASGQFPTSFQLATGSLTRNPGRPEGSGGSAIIWKGDYGGRAVAMKVFRGCEIGDIPHQDMKAILKEAVVWKHLRHRNIVPFIGIDYEIFPLSLVCEWMSNGTVVDYLTSNHAINRLQLLHDVAKGLHYLHGMGIVHGDLKGVNVLVNADGVACLSDFGLAVLGHQGKLTTVSVAAWSTRWIAPEVLDPEAFGLLKAQLTRKSDMYSLGMVAWEIFTGLLPFHDVKFEGAIYGRILKGIRPQRATAATLLGLTDDIWDLMKQCWKAIPETRPDISDILTTLDGVLQHVDVARLQEPTSWPLIMES
ncbi:hypothetical protein CERSUDRAFT_115163 [Gelatoporia subvermispora B]|uniref:Autophagy-related protein 13 n=1 Tax=Ceriporiopsis subvermispora (strain B) TaxID=914234 RepID=M2QVU5_CERS8|nr:hypothetical protein CERSUDRAFT_115163 [Gelatoporia subvermispora B]